MRFATLYNTETFDPIFLSAGVSAQYRQLVFSGRMVKVFLHEYVPVFD